MQISVLGSTTTTLPPSVYPRKVLAAREPLKHMAQRQRTEGILGDAVTLSTPPPASPPPAPVSRPAPVVPREVVVRLPALPPVRPLRLACSVATTADSEEPDDEREDQPSLPAVPDLPEVVASPGQDDGQPDHGGSPAESPCGIVARPACMVGVVAL